MFYALTSRELILRCHCSLHELGFDEPGAKSIRIFCVVLHTKINTIRTVLDTLQIFCRFVFCLHLYQPGMKLENTFILICCSISVMSYIQKARVCQAAVSFVSYINSSSTEGSLRHLNFI